MKKQFANKVFYVLFSFVTCLPDCFGQLQTFQLKDSISKQSTTLAGQPKLIKTQGSNPYDNVHCGLQDRNGNLWFGTTGEGVYRYDGKSFLQFTTKEGLSSNTVWSILEDKEGNIWAGTNAGICIYPSANPTVHVQENKFRPVQIVLGYLTHVLTLGTALVASANNTEVFSMLQDNAGTIWFGTSDGMFCYYTKQEGQDKVFTRFTDNPRVINKAGLTLKSIQCMLQDKNGDIWFGSGPMAFEGIARYDGKTLENFKPRNESWIRTIFQTNTGNILFASRHNGLCIYNGTKFSFNTDSTGKLQADMMGYFEDKAGNTWSLCDYGEALNDSAGGVWRYEAPHNGNAGAATTAIKFSTKDGLVDNAAFFIMEDRAGNIWVGTRNTGLYRYDPALKGSTGRGGFVKYSE